MWQDSRPCYCDSEIIASSSSHDCFLSRASQRHGASSRQIVSLHQRVCLFDDYNFLGARLPVPSSLNIPLWRSRLQDYPDYAVCDFLEFGWPVGLDYASSLSTDHVTRNHKGATDFPLAVESYLSLELDRGAVIGPFASNPFSRSIVISPLNSVPKPDSSERRMILDLSWPSGSSINDAIPDRIYLSHPYSLVYPTIDTIADRVASLGRGCLLFKRDLKRAYRQFPIDPFDYPLLGYQWNGELYFDVVLPMGLKTAAMACQRSTSAVCYMLTQDGCYVVNYLDDFIGVASPDKALQDYELCGSLLRDLGLQESPSKACPPSTVLTCLGVEVNTLDLTLSVTPARLQELETMLLQWSSRRSATKSELQSLIGKLSFVTKCVRQSRLFLSRILALLRTLKRNHYHTKLSKEFHRDIKWWLRFLRTYNGVSVIPSSLWSAPDGVFSTDACLTGCGGLTDQFFFHCEFPDEVTAQFHFIHHLEALAILVACRLWGSSWQGLRIIVQCDNEAVVSSLNSGRVQDPYLAICLRAIWFQAASHEFELRATHLSSSANRLADFLSRWHLNSSYKEQFLAATGTLTLQEVVVHPSLFSLTDDL